VVIDTLRMAKRLREAGFSDPPAEAVITTVQESAEGTDLATKHDLAEAIAVLKADIAELRARFKADIAELRAELRGENAAVRAEGREAELRLEARMQALNSQLITRVFGMILSAVVINIVAIVGAVFGVAKLLGH
jgi:hypothetical protein